MATTTAMTGESLTVEKVKAGSYLMRDENGVCVGEVYKEGSIWQVFACNGYVGKLKTMAAGIQACRDVYDKHQKARQAEAAAQVGVQTEWEINMFKEAREAADARCVHKVAYIRSLVYDAMWLDTPTAHIETVDKLDEILHLEFSKAIGLPTLKLAVEYLATNRQDDDKLLEWACHLEEMGMGESTYKILNRFI